MAPCRASQGSRHRGARQPYRRPLHHLEVAGASLPAHLTLGTALSLCLPKGPGILGIPQSLALASKQPLPSLPHWNLTTVLSSTGDASTIAVMGVAVSPGVADGRAVSMGRGVVVGPDGGDGEAGCAFRPGLEVSGSDGGCGGAGSAEQPPSTKPMNITLSTRCECTVLRPTTTSLRCTACSSLCPTLLLGLSGRKRH